MCGVLNMAEIKPSLKCPYTSTYKWKGITPSKKFVFLTRVSRIQNVQKIKDHLLKIFSEALSVDYQHILLADLTVGNKIEDFDKFKDQKTIVFPVEQKVENDKYCSFNIDQCVHTLILAEEDCWIYLLDDDNLVTDDFAEVAQYCGEERVVVFNIKMPKINNGFDGTIKAPLEYKKALFHIDAANFIVHRSVFEQCRFGFAENSAWSDGVFMQKILFKQIPIKYVDKVYSHHNGL